jgi:predicted flap endonuclease-1-like 5' DNA nuclease
MLFSYILLQCTFWDHLPTALLLCLLPFLLGWLFAYAFHGVGSLRGQINSLTTQNGELNGKINALTSDLTDVRVKLTQAEAEIERLTEQLRKAKSDLMLAESERNALREQLANASGGALESMKAAAPKSITFAGAKYKWDDLKIVEGIGPKIAELLINAGINTWKTLSETAVDKLKEILEAGGPNFQIHDPGTWPSQARLADEGNWDELKKLQDELSGGKA